jgi:hypothetical protein
MWRQHLALRVAKAIKKTAQQTEKCRHACDLKVLVVLGAKSNGRETTTNHTKAKEAIPKL